MYNQVRSYIKSRIQIPERDLEESFKYASIKYFKKGDYILRIGEYCRFIGFVNSGMILSTILYDGKEIASNFTFENCFFTYTEGLNQNIPSHKNSVALEDCEMLIIEKEKLPLIFSINSKFETLFTQILADELRYVLINEQNSRTLSAESRYLQFIEMFPTAFNRIPLKHIAGYLGIEPPSLSRLRKKLAGR